MPTHELHVGQHVMVSHLSREGVVEAIDGPCARVVLYSDAREVYARIDELEVRPCRSGSCQLIATSPA